MLVVDLLLFGVCFFLVLRSADYAIRYATRIARLVGLTDFVISFFIVAIISALPETIIGFVAHMEGKPDIALMTLLGSKVIDLTLVFGILAFVGRGVRVESQLMRKDALYLVLVLLPLLLGIDGEITRPEGLVLVIAGLMFFYTLTIEKNLFHTAHKRHHPHIARALLLLGASLVVMLVSAHFTIVLLGEVAVDIGVPEILVALLVIATGTCLPEAIFAVRSVLAKHDGLALGDLLGVVIIDATIVLGIFAIVQPIVVDVTFLRVLGLFLAISACLLIYFIKRRHSIGRVEGIMLFALYIAFIAVQFRLHYG
jgi:cation:H+ antiporter